MSNAVVWFLVRKEGGKVILYRITHRAAIKNAWVNGELKCPYCSLGRCEHDYHPFMFSPQSQWLNDLFMGLMKK